MTTDLKKLAEDQVKYFRNVANHGRGSEMTKALHDACDEIERLQRNTLRPKPDHCLLDIPMGTPCAMAGYCDYTTPQQEVETLRRDIETGFMEGAYARLKNLQEAEREVETLREEIKRLKALGLRESNRLADERKYTRELEARLARHEEAAPQETKP